MNGWRVAFWVLGALPVVVLLSILGYFVVLGAWDEWKKNREGLSILLAGLGYLAAIVFCCYMGTP